MPAEEGGPPKRVRCRALRRSAVGHAGGYETDRPGRLRRGREVNDEAAAVGDVVHVHVATVRLHEPAHAGEIRAALAGWQLIPQRGAGLAERLAHAHADAAVVEPGQPLLQIGMDTPQIAPEMLTAAASQLSGTDAVLGPTGDGGWWLLGLRDPAHAAALRGVPMSTPDTGRLTRLGLSARGLRVADALILSDVDTWDDALVVADAMPGSRFAAAVAR